MDVLGVACLRRQIRRLFGLFEYVLDAVIPPRERSLRTKQRSLADIPLTPTVHELLNTQITTIMEYRESSVQDLIRSLKYDGSPYAAYLAASALADYLREEIASVKLYSPRKILLVPIPLHSSRARERGFNQIEIVLRALPEEFKDGVVAALAPHALMRTRANKSQTHLSRQERLKNVSDAFEASDEVRGTHVFLIDDVTTTGATLKCAGLALKKAGAEVTLLALARA